jgi:hypothetical protein
MNFFSRIKRRIETRTLGDISSSVPPVTAPDADASEPGRASPPPPPSYPRGSDPSRPDAVYIRPRLSLIGPGASSGDCVSLLEENHGIGQVKLWKLRGSGSLLSEESPTRAQVLRAEESWHIVDVPVGFGPWERAPPAIDQLCRILYSLYTWLALDDRHIAAVQCPSADPAFAAEALGLSMAIICGFLVFNRDCETVADALSLVRRSCRVSNGTLRLAGAMPTPLRRRLSQLVALADQARTSIDSESAIGALLPRPPTVRIYSIVVHNLPPPSKGAGFFARARRPPPPRLTAFLQTDISDFSRGWPAPRAVVLPVFNSETARSDNVQWNAEDGLLSIKVDLARRCACGVFCSYLPLPSHELLRTLFAPTPTTNTRPSLSLPQPRILHLSENANPILLTKFSIWSSLLLKKIDFLRRRDAGADGACLYQRATGQSSWPKRVCGQSPEDPLANR